MSHWEGILEFVTVAETASFSAAARRLDTSVANVSRRIASLEEHLAVKLFLRTTRKVSLTEVGKTYYVQCKPLLDGLEQANLTVTKMQSKPSGRGLPHGGSWPSPMHQKKLSTWVSRVQSNRRWRKSATFSGGPVEPIV